MTAKNDEPLSIIRQLELMRDLQRLANERAESEARIRTALADGLRAAEELLDAVTKSVATEYASARDAAKREYDQSHYAIQGFAA